VAERLETIRVALTRKRHLVIVERGKINLLILFMVSPKSTSALVELAERLFFNTNFTGWQWLYTFGWLPFIFQSITLYPLLKIFNHFVL